jgi:hypothetical protein
LYQCGGERFFDEPALIVHTEIGLPVFELVELEQGLLPLLRAFLELD